MKPPLAKLRPTLAELTQSAREKASAEVFDLSRVREQLTAAASNGTDHCAIRPERPVNLRATRAAQALEAWLVREGLPFVWRNVRDRQDGAEFLEIVISWPAPPELGKTVLE